MAKEALKMALTDGMSRKVYQGGFVLSVCVSIIEGDRYTLNARYGEYGNVSLATGEKEHLKPLSIP